MGGKMQDRELDFNVLIDAMGELARRSLVTLVPVFVALVALGLTVDFYYADYSIASLFVGVAQLVISYFLMKGLARHSGLLAEGEEGPGFMAYFGVSLAIGLGTALGFLLLVLPGIFLSVRWMLAFPFLFSGETYEGSSGSISSSWEMTRPVFWKLLAGYIVSIVFLAISLYAYYHYAIALDRTTELVWLSVANVAGAASTIYMLVLGFAAFLVLRTDREELERVFA